jgi:co-chaperonin GroES (HSP10)
MIDEIIPIGERVLIIPHIKEKKGLLILENQKPEFYEVIAIGCEVSRVKVGDLVLVNTYHGNVFRHPEFMIVDEEAIVGFKKTQWNVQCRSAND